MSEGSCAFTAGLSPQTAERPDIAAFATRAIDLAAGVERITACGESNKFAPAAVSAARSRL